MTVREEAHRLIDAVPEEQLPDAVEMLRQWASPEPGDVPYRRFRTTAIFDGEPDLGTLSVPPTPSSSLSRRDSAR
jgi:hypothetical protein